MSQVQATTYLEPHTKPSKITATKLGWTICILAAVFYCYEYLLRIAPAAMVPELREAFQLDATAFGALISLYYLVYTPMQAVVGLAHDLYGPKRMLTLAVFTCVVGSLLFGLSTTTELAAVGRLLMGFGSAFAFVGAMKLAAVWLPGNRFAMFAGAITALGMIGGMFGNIFMAVFVEKISWQQTYFIGAASGLVLMLFVWLIVKDHPSHVKTQPQTGKHVKVSYRETFHGIYMMVKTPQMWIAGIVACGLYLSLSGFAELWGNSFVEKVYGFSVSDAATANSMVFFGWLIGAPLMGLLSDHFKRRRLPLILTAIAALIVSVLMLTWTQPTFYTACTLLFLFGLFTSAEVICFALGRENAAPELAGTAVAFVNLIVMAGGLIAQPLIGKLLDHYWSGELMADGVRTYGSSDFQHAMVILPVGCVIALVCAFFLHETKTELRGKSVKASLKS